MANPELVDPAQESQEKSQEQLANQKFDEIFNKVFDIWNSFEDKFSKYSSINLNREDGTSWWIQVSEDIKTWDKSIEIFWYEHEDKPGSIYMLSREWWKYSLVSGFDKKDFEDDIRERNTVNNLTSQELLNNILPNFERRLNEWETLKAQERQHAIENANQYVYQQDLQDADRLLQKNGLG